MLCFLNPFCTSLSSFASCKTMKSESVQDKNFVQLCYCHRKSCLAPHFSSFFSWSKMIERSSKMVQKSWQELRSTVIVCLFPTICLVPTFSSDSASRFSTVCQNIIFRSKIQCVENTYVLKSQFDFILPKLAVFIPIFTLFKMVKKLTDVNSFTRRYEMNKPMRKKLAKSCKIVKECCFQLDLGNFINR